MALPSEIFTQLCPAQLYFAINLPDPFLREIVWVAVDISAVSFLRIIEFTNKLLGLEPIYKARKSKLKVSTGFLVTDCEI